jgi:hypothetical protein
MVTTQILQMVLALLLAIQGNPAIPDSLRDQALQISQMAIQAANTPQVLGMISAPLDGAVWKANSDNLKITWQKITEGDARWWPSAVRIDLEGYFGKTYAQELPISNGLVPNTGATTIAPSNFSAGQYKLFVIGLKDPNSNVGSWAITPPQNIIIQ